jgi:NAD(P)-dependent dehydrogenase (short-subunit alcohol dehydrogenase family)
MMLITGTGTVGAVGRETARLLVDGGAKVAAVTRNPHSGLPTGTQRPHPAEVASLARRLTTGGQL